MKKIFPLLLAAVFLLGFSASAFAAEPVDLTGKKGVVDPNDLKKYDPKPAEKPKSDTSNSGSNKQGADKEKHLPGHGSYGIAK